MEDDSPGAQDGRSFWSGIRALIFGDNGQITAATAAANPFINSTKRRFNDRMQGNLEKGDE